MIGEQNSQEKTKNVSTKVPIWVAELLNLICASRGTDIYGLLKLVLEFIIETAKVSGPVPPAMQTILHMLKMDVDWNRAFAFSDPSATMDVAQVILVLQQHDKDGARQGFGLAMIDKPFLPGEEPTMTLCVDDILERVAEVSMKGLYRELRQVGVALETESLRETLTMMCDAQLLKHLDESDRCELPQVGDFHDFGKQIQYGRKTKRKPHRTPDSLDADQRIKQQTIIFDDYDRDVSDYEAEGWEGNYPQTDFEPPAGYERDLNEELSRQFKDDD
jgi:hypothetical protein